MLVGYARVSTADQTLALQQDALKQAGCERLFTDTASGSHVVRPGLDEALGFVRPGDTLVVWRLDRLGRSLRHFIDTVSLLQERGIGFRSLQEQIDTTTSGGKLVFHVFGALAEFERDLIRERTQAGLLAARARGRLGGHPRAPALNTPRKVQIAQALYNDKSNSITDICRWQGRTAHPGRGQAAAQAGVAAPQGVAVDRRTHRGDHAHRGGADEGALDPGEGGEHGCADGGGGAAEHLGEAELQLRRGGWGGLGTHEGKEGPPGLDAVLVNGRLPGPGEVPHRCHATPGGRRVPAGRAGRGSAV